MSGTLILTAAGYVVIEMVKAGDRVISTNADTLETAEKTVLETYVRETTEVVHLTVNGEVITSTLDHPFYVQDAGFVGAGNLYIGDKLLDADGNTLLLEDMKVETLTEPVKVYNFQVEDFHTYHVGQCKIFVHNADCGGSYQELKKVSDTSVEQVHHMPANSSSPLSTNDGVAIIMDTPDHKQTASFDNKPGSKAYRKKQADLIRNGKFQEAFDMDVADIKSKFPGKYDENIKQAQTYLSELLKKGIVK